MVRLNPQFVKKNGKPEFVVLTCGEFRRLVGAAGDAEDLRTLRAARKANVGKEGITLAQHRAKHHV